MLFYAEIWIFEPWLYSGRSTARLSFVIFVSCLLSLYCGLKHPVNPRDMTSIILVMGFFVSVLLNVAGQRLGCTSEVFQKIIGYKFPAG